MGGASSPKTAMSNRLASPPGPNKALKAAAVTTVGSTKGTVVREWIRLLPLKVKVANTQAPGRATSRVSRVERPACQVVNQSTCAQYASPKSRPRVPGTQPSPPTWKLAQKMLTRG